MEEKSSSGAQPPCPAAGKRRLRADAAAEGTMAEEVAPCGRPRTQLLEEVDVEPDRAPAAAGTSTEHAGENSGTQPLPHSLGIHGAAIVA